MEYAIVEISGRQFWVEKDKYYDLNRLPLEVGLQVHLNRILLVKNNGNTLVGQPYVENITVKAKVLKHFRGRKILVYKMRPKKKTRKKQGHRQDLTRILIQDIIINK